MIPEKYKQYIPYIVCGCILLFFASLYFNRTESLQKKVVELTNEAKVNEALAKEYRHQYDLLKAQDNPLQSKNDSLKLELQKSQKTIIKLKTIYNEKIKIINKYSVSDMQSYFDKRTRESGNSGFDTIQ